MKNITTVYKKSMKMSDLIDADYKLLHLLDRLEFSLGFSEKSVETICKENHFDADCFIFLAKVQSDVPIADMEREFNELPLEHILHYLKLSHNYFLENRLPSIRRKLDVVFEEGNKDLHDMVMRFFDFYTKEVMDHMHYEDDVVFPYVDALVVQDLESRYSIDIFEEVHTDIEGKMNDLKQILMKYVSVSSNRSLMIRILLEIYSISQELELHTFLEDKLLIPRVRAVEDRA